MPQQDADPGAGDDLGPAWDLYRRMADSPDVRPARRDAVVWALRELERRTGPDWLERYWESAGHVPAEVNLGSGHVAAFGNLLDLALGRISHCRRSTTPTTFQRRYWDNYLSTCQELREAFQIPS